MASLTGEFMMGDVFDFRLQRYVKNLDGEKKSECVGMQNETRRLEWRGGGGVRGM